MSVRLVPAMLVVGFLGGVLARSADASRAELEARALPPLLAVDPTNVLVLPASLGGLPRQVELDYTFGTGRFAMGMAGRSPRVAYVLDGKSHNLYVGGGSWGMVLGIQDSYDSRESGDLSLNPDYPYARQEEGTLSRRTVRLGVGWQHDFGGDRVFQLGLGGSWIDADWTAAYLYASETTLDLNSFSWYSDPGWGIDATLQILSLRSGLLLAMRYAYSDLSPNATLDPPYPFDIRDRRQSARIHLGWRFRTDVLDDLAAGWTFAWEESWAPRDPRYSNRGLSQEKTTTYAGDLFLSGTKHVWKGFTVLGGVRGPIAFTEDTLEQIDFRSQAADRITRTKYDDGGIGDPEIRLGVTWAWRSLILTGQLRESLSLTDPFVRWAATLTY